MLTANYPGNLQWKQWQKISFRFFFIYFILFISPWTLIEFIPGGELIRQYYYLLADWCVETSNRLIFHVRDVLVPMNGSGDTSYAWAQLWMTLSLAALGAIVWSFFGRRTSQYNALSYWLRITVRYFIIINCISYGYSKVFLLQMPFPSTSNLATPLGDFLPMRLSWLFMGYSSHYQFFTGLLEVTAGILLLYRRTVTLGLFFAAGIFLNVMMLNLSYDIPVKIFSIHLFLMCMFLLSFEAKRIISFFVLNQPATATDLYAVSFDKRWMRIGRIILKLTFIFFIVVWQFKDIMATAESNKVISSNKYLPNGFYEVKTFIRNRDTIPACSGDTIRWQDVIIDNAMQGTIKTSDTLFNRRYGRARFNFAVHEQTHEIDFSKRTQAGDSIFLFKMHFALPDSNTIQLSGLIKSDSVFAELKNTHRHFQLTERQFHWLSEYNR